MADGAGDTAQGGFLAALRLPDYRLLWLSSLFSSGAYWALLIGRNWLVLKLSGSAGWVGVVTFANMVPFFVATPAAGIIADRFDRRQLMAVTQAISLLSTVVLVVLTFAGVVTPWQIAVLAFIAGCAKSGEAPATSSIVPNLVGKDLLLNAFALASVAMFGSRLVGSASGGGVQVQFGAGGVFVFASILWLFAIAFILRVAGPTRDLAPRAEPATGVWQQTTETLAYIGATPMIALLFVIVGLHCVLTMSIDSVLPTYSSRVLHASNGGIYSLLVMGIGAGSLVGTFGLAGLRSNQGKGMLFLITGIGSGLSTALLGLSTSFVPAFFASVLVGATQGMFMALGTTLLQEVVPDLLRGRVSSAFLMATGGAMSFANLGFGYLTDSAGAGVALFAPGILFVALLLLIGAVRPDLRRIFRSGSLEMPAVPV